MTDVHSEYDICSAIIRLCEAPYFLVIHTQILKAYKNQERGGGRGSNVFTHLLQMGQCIQLLFMGKHATTNKVHIFSTDRWVFLLLSIMTTMVHYMIHKAVHPLLIINSIKWKSES